MNDEEAKGPRYDIGTKSGRIAGPFSREDLKRYAADGRLDPRCAIRLHDPKVDHPWRPCWDTKGLFPPEIVELCRREDALGTDEGVPALRAEEDVHDHSGAFDSAYLDETRDAYEMDGTGGFEEDETGQHAGFETHPALEDAAATRARTPVLPTSGSVRWARHTTRVIIVAVVLHLVLASVIGFTSYRNALTMPAGPPGSTEGTMMGLLRAALILPVAALIAAVACALLLQIGFLIVDGQTRRSRHVFGSALRIVVFALVFAGSSEIAVRLCAGQPGSTGAIALGASQFVCNVACGVSVLLGRHRLGMRQALVVYAMPLLLAIVLILIGGGMLGVRLFGMV